MLLLKSLSILVLCLFTVLPVEISAEEFLENASGNFYQDTQELLKRASEKLQRTAFFLNSVNKEKVAIGIQNVIQKIVDKVYSDLEAFDDKKKEDLEKGINIVSKFLDDLKYKEVEEKFFKLYNTYVSSVQTLKEQAKELSESLKQQQNSPEVIAQAA